MTGNIKATGSITGASKSFCIPHPSPEKKAQGYHLRHWCIETDMPAGLVMYRRTIEMTTTSLDIEMPSWFSSLVEADSITIHLSPSGHFGSGFGECSGNIISLRTTTLGAWYVLVYACRADEHAKCCEKEIEYIPTQTPSTDDAFPNTS